MTANNKAKEEFWKRPNGIFVNMFHRMDHEEKAIKILDNGTVFDQFIDKILHERYKDGWRDRSKQSDLEHSDCSECKFNSDCIIEKAWIELANDNLEACDDYDKWTSPFRCNKSEPKDKK